jgi:hypothetical protein
MESTIPKTLIITQPKVAYMPFRVIRIKGWVQFNEETVDLQAPPMLDDYITPVEIVITLRRNKRNGKEELTSAVVSTWQYGGPVQAVFT